MKSLHRAAWAAAVVLGLGGCKRVERFALPEQPEADLAFAVLYDDADRIQRIGPVTTRNLLYADQYVLEDQGSLRARLFFVSIEALQQSADATCDDLPIPAERAVCRSIVQSCTDAPQSCLKVVAAEEQCNGRIELSRSLPSQVFESDEGGRLEPLAVEQSATLLSAARLCGPFSKPDCPVRLPGFIITEDSIFRCLAPAEQEVCRLTVNLTECGIADLSATIAPSGDLQVEAGGCAIAAGLAEATEAEPSVYELDCQGQRYQATHLEAYFAEPECPRRGPATFDSELATSGGISGAVAVDIEEWGPRLLLMGDGFDDCAAKGCSYPAGVDCSSRCRFDCNAFELVPCTTNAWATCVQGSAKDACLERCERWCDRPRSGCSADARGSVLTTGALDAPERALARVNIDEGGTKERALGVSALVSLTVGDAKLLAAATRHELTILQPQSTADTFERPLTERLDLAIAGLLATEEGDELVVFGTDEGTQTARILRARVRLGREPFLDTTELPTPPDSPSVDRATLGGPSGRWVFAIEASDRVGTESEARSLLATPLDEGPAPVMVALPGAPSALIGVPDGTVLVAVRRGDGNGSDFALIDASASPPAQMSAHAGLPGLVVRSLLIDPNQCDEQRCHVFVGYERVASDGPALVGLFSYNPRSPELSRTMSALAPTSSSELSAVTAAWEDHLLFAVAANRNLLTPLRLLE